MPYLYRAWGVGVFKCKYSTPSNCLLYLFQCRILIKHGKNVIICPSEYGLNPAVIPRHTRRYYHHIIPSFIRVFRRNTLMLRWDRGWWGLLISPEGCHPPSPAPSGGTGPWPWCTPDWEAPLHPVNTMQRWSDKYLCKDLGRHNRIKHHIKLHLKKENKQNSQLIYFNHR